MKRARLLYAMKKYLFYFVLIFLIACSGNETKSDRKDDGKKIVENKVYLSSWGDAARTRIESWVKALSTSHPEFQKDPVLKGVIDGDMEILKKAGTSGLVKVINASHNDQTEEAFNQAVRNWMGTAKDKKFGKTYKELIYQPMAELLEYLRANDFKTFIVSGGGVDFMRAFAEETYGIPPYQVVGSYSDAKYEVINGKPIVTKISGTPFVDDKAGKPVGIHRFIGKVPVFCAGNSDGDQAMLQYTSGSKYKSFCMIIHHTDAEREYQYDSPSTIGHLETAMVEAKEKNWMIVDMKNDFKKVFAFQ